MRNDTRDCGRAGFVHVAPSDVECRVQLAGPLKEILARLAGMTNDRFAVVDVTLTEIDEETVFALRSALLPEKT